ncbi:TPA: DUF2787 family protein [Vibrio parahaemolyticus]|nr:DUF2787 domain-containing protein [Vibrio parahaemolyticus]EGR0926929.1 DUF2787 domain-containing protein [Vibrio parahaemolyticus]EGR3234053.1 hypothetical protein [Vibrio parahaemolyticus]EGX7689041.1 DUF2787 domain-containing protein [Vibrio parahaemolyticus]EHR1015517.1 DUF2787 family protein [Vibrio parahaemolyticus]
MTLNFRDSADSPEADRFHPVEVLLHGSNQTHG